MIDEYKTREAWDGTPSEQDTALKRITDLQDRLLMPVTIPPQIYPNEALILGQQFIVTNGNAKTSAHLSDSDYLTYVRQNPAAQNNQITAQFMAEAGNYEVRMRVRKTSSAGLAEFYVDGIYQLGDIDFYNNPELRNTDVTFTITVPTDGRHTFTMRMYSKRAASSGYDYGLHYVVMRKI